MKDNIPNISSIFSVFRGTDVLIIGDIMLDRYIHCKTDRMSAEAPIPVWDSKKTDNRLGGAANVAVNIKNLGGNPIIVSVVGDDADGHLLLQEMTANYIDTTKVGLDVDRKTTVKTRLVAQNHQLLRHDSESRHDLDEKQELLLLNRFFEALDEYNPKVIVAQDYNKGVLTRKVIANIIYHANQRNIPIAVDPKMNNFLEYQGCTLFKPNLKEACYYLDKEVSKFDAENLAKASHAIHKAMNCKFTVITLSENGMILAEDEDSLMLPAYERAVCDVSGAGDTVISILAVGLALDLDMIATAEMANIAGGLVCEKAGVVGINLRELIRETENIYREILEDFSDDDYLDREFPDNSEEQEEEKLEELQVLSGYQEPDQEEVEEEKFEDYFEGPPAFRDEKKDDFELSENVSSNIDEVLETFLKESVK